MIRAVTDREFDQVIARAHLPVLVDPSHPAGAARYVPPES